MNERIPNLGPLNSEPYRIRPPFNGDWYRVEQKRGESRETWSARCQDDRVAALLEALGDVELGTYDHRIIEWLADWDHGTVGTIASLFYRARAAGGDR